MECLDKQGSAFTSVSHLQPSPQNALSAQSHTENKFFLSHFTLQKTNSIWSKGFSESKVMMKTVREMFWGEETFLPLTMYYAELISS